MTGIPGFTREEIREFVFQYALVPHGHKAEWLASKPFSGDQLRRWRDMVFHGDLDRGLVPREHWVMSDHSKAWEGLERDRAALIAAHDTEVAHLKARISELEGVNDALGKAIGLLHDLSGKEPDASTMNEPSSS